MRKLLTLIFAAFFVGVISLPLTAQAARVNTLIKGSGSTIYWAANNGKKYTFPNIATYYTWFSWADLSSSVKKISDKELKAIPTAGNVTYRGGAKLVKFPNEATVYAVSRYSILRPILNADIAAQLYGWNWNTKVETIPWNLRGDYTIGSMIRNAWEYSTSVEYNGVSTPSDNLPMNVIVGTTPFNPNAPVSTFSGTVNIALTNRLYTPDRAQFTATVSNSNRNANELTIQIKNETRNEIVQTCYASYTCSATWYVDTVATQEFVAIVKDASNYSLGSNRLSVQGLNSSSYSSNPSYPYYYGSNYPYYGYNYNTTPYYGSIGTVNLSLSSSNVYQNETITAYADVKNSSLAADRLSIEIFVDGTRIGTCQNTATCSLTFNNPTVNATRQVYARAYDAYNNANESARQTIYVSTRTPSWTQGTFWADRALTAEWTSDRTLRLTGRITNSNRETQNLRLSIIDTSNNQTIKNCTGTDYCTIDVRIENNWVNSSQYALRAYDVNGQEVGYVYANSVGTNPYAYNSYNNGYNYYNSSASVTTDVYRANYNTWNPTYTVTGSVNANYNYYLNNTRLEIYAIDTYTGSQMRLVTTCYGVTTCTTQDTPTLNYGTVSYYTVFIDSNGTQLKSSTRSS